MTDVVFAISFVQFYSLGQQDLLHFSIFVDRQDHIGPAKRICVFEHSVMTNFNCACPAIQRGQGSGFLSEGSS